jgi:serine/threonine protein kinase
LADFGAIKIIPQSGVALGKTLSGTPMFAPPEMYDPKHEITPGFDVWSLGVTLFCMLTHHFPWPKDISCLDQLIIFMRLRLPEMLDQGQIDLPHPLLDTHSRDLIASMLVLANNRPSIAQLMEHQFFQQEYPVLRDTDTEMDRYDVMDKLACIRHGIELTLTEEPDDYHLTIDVDEDTQTTHKSWPTDSQNVTGQVEYHPWFVATNLD